MAAFNVKVEPLTLNASCSYNLLYFIYAHKASQIHALLRMLDVLVEEKGWKWSTFDSSQGLGCSPGPPNDDS